ncbi:MAG: MFS transporter, partial [Gammaproteobacteria bacterium]
MQNAADPSEENGWPAPRLAWYALALLSLAYVLSYLDRILINLLIEPIQAQFDINDTQFGMLQSLAFGIFYTVMALPLGRLADARDRRLIVAGGIALFSLFTALSGLARSYMQLFFARVGVGVGEASLTPSAYSLLSDYFPPERLGRAIGIFTMSAFVGTGLAYIGGGAVVEWLAKLDAFELPGFGTLQPWQLTFVLIGIPGLLLAPVMLTMREPRRRGVQKTEPAPLSEVLAELRKRRRTLVFMFAGFSMVTFSSYASAVWTPAFFIRTYGW